MASPFNEKPNRRYRFWLVWFAIWSGYALCNSIVTSIQENQPWLPQGGESLLSYSLLSLLGVPVWYWVTMVLRNRPLAIQIAGHLFGAIAYALTWYAVYHALFPVFFGLEAYRNEPFEHYYLYTLDEAVKVYGTITAIYYAWHYHRNRQAQKHREAEVRAYARQMELAALKSQLNPHFLFNSLNSVNALVGKDPERARTVLAHLADTLRYTLDSDRATLVTLGEELDFVTTWLAIERERFGKRLTVTMAVPEGLRDWPVPPMILQPVVENAVSHGIAPMLAGGSITIIAHNADDTLIMEVTDTGAGSERDPEELLAAGRGLHHTHLRLISLYREGGGLTLFPKGPGFRAVLAIPAAAGMALGIQPGPQKVSLPDEQKLPVGSVESGHA